MLEEIKKNVNEVEFVGWVQDEEGITALKCRFENVKEAILDVNNNVKKNFIKIGYELDYIKTTGLFRYAHKPGEHYVVYNQFNTDSFTDFVRDYFGFSKTTTKNLIAIHNRFSLKGFDGRCLEEYEPYSYSQLVEMLPLSNEEIVKVNPEMSIREIREIKKSLIDNLSEHKLSSYNEKKPSEPKNSEAGSQNHVFDLKKKKDEFRLHCKNFFEAFAYELKLNDRKQGGFAFGSLFFSYLEEKGFFNV